jgi:glucose/arabinose dehydrogenase
MIRRTLTICAGLLMAFTLDASAQIRFVPYVSGLSAPVEFVQDPTSPFVQFVVEQGGRIRAIDHGTLLPTPFLDVSAVISTGGERGLLGLAFAPDYIASRRFFVNFTDPAGNTVVARFKRSTDNALIADPATRFDLRWGGGPAYIVQPFANHNGGHLAFGPDGFLYVGMGDGGSGDDPLNNGQRADTLLGKLLRIDVSVDDSDPEGYDIPADNPFVDGVPIPALPEIWAFGVRNPWKFTFDQPALGGTGAMLIADVGQNRYEEIDYQPPAAGGRNYGWRVFEGAHPDIDAPGAAYLPLTGPIAEYDHTVGSSITGGFVYRGYSLGTAFRGRYFFADFVARRVWSMALLPDGSGGVSASSLVEHTAELGGSAVIGNVSAFGVDAFAELYIVNYSSGQILKVLPHAANRRLDPSDIDGDHKSDPLVWRPSTGAWLGVRSSDAGSFNRLFGAGYAPYNDIPVPGDYDGDGKSDLAVWRPLEGGWYVRNSSNDSVTFRQWGAGYSPYNDIPVSGDYDGDGRTDIAIWRPMDGGWYIRNSSNDGITFRQWGAGYAPYNDIPVPGDYDGDGKTDIAVWRPVEGNWYILNSSSRSVTIQQWGAGYAPENDIPVPGDYDGDGKTDIAVWRPFEGNWYILNSSSRSVTIQQWGAGYAPYNDIPVPGDYDGDGKTDPSIWRASDGGVWYVRGSSNGLMVLQSGAPGDVP